MTYLPQPSPIEEASADEIAVLELKGTLHQADGGWTCVCHGTETGYGTTPDAAYQEWQRKLFQPESFHDDAYDTVERDYLRLLNDL